MSAPICTAGSDQGRAPGAVHAAVTGWVIPPNPDAPGDYWLTRRSADSAPDYDLGLPDIRVQYRWNGRGAWVTGYYEGIQRREPALSCLHSNNGWRIAPDAVAPTDWSAATRDFLFASANAHAAMYRAMHTTQGTH